MTCAASERFHQRALVLVGVLWVLILLTLIATSLSLSSRSFARQTQNGEQAVIAGQVADAGVIWVLWSLQQANNAGWLADGSQQQMTLGGHDLSVALFDDSGKIDLNAAPTELLDGLLAQVIDDSGEREALVAAIEDWRDADDLVRLNGAEEAQYLAAGRSSGPANRDFEALSELAGVLGMTPEVYQRIRWSLTLNNATRTVNPQFAPFDVLMALPGASAVAVQDYIDDRRRAWQAQLPLPPLPFEAAGYTSNERAGLNYSAFIEARIEPWTRIRRVADITLSGGLPTVRAERALFDDAGAPATLLTGGDDEH